MADRKQQGLSLILALLFQEWEVKGAHIFRNIRTLLKIAKKTSS